MFEDVSSFLKRFNSLKPPERFVQEHVCEAVKTVCGIRLRKRDMSVRGKMVYITTSPAAKSEIILHKQAILKILSRGVSEGVIQDIR